LEKSLTLSKVFDTLGIGFATPVNETQHPGSYNISFSQQRTQLSSGGYFFQLCSFNGGKTFLQTKRMIALK